MLVFLGRNEVRLRVATRFMRIARCNKSPFYASTSSRGLWSWFIAFM